MTLTYRIVCSCKKISLFNHHLKCLFCSFMKLHKFKKVVNTSAASDIFFKKDIWGLFLHLVVWFEKIIGTCAIGLYWNNLILYNNSTFKEWKVWPGILQKQEGYDEMTWWKASQFVIFLEYENSCIFLFFISWYFIFPLMNALLYDNIDQGIQ